MPSPGVYIIGPSPAYVAFLLLRPSTESERAVHGRLRRRAEARATTGWPGRGAEMGTEGAWRRREH